MDTPLPSPPQRVLIMENYRPAWADLPGTEGDLRGDLRGDLHYGEFPEESIEQWTELEELQQRFLDNR